MAKIKYLAIDESDRPQGILYAHSRVSAQAYLDTKKLPYIAVKAKDSDQPEGLPLLLGTPRTTPGKDSTGYRRAILVCGLSEEEVSYLDQLAREHRLSSFTLGLLRSHIKQHGAKQNEQHTYLPNL